MDPEIKKELAEIHALAKDNHDMLRAIRRDQWISFVGKLIFWAVVLALPLYFYQQYLQPIVEKFYVPSGSASSSIPGLPDVSGLPSSAELQKLINSYKTGL